MNTYESNEVKEEPIIDLDDKIANEILTAKARKPRLNKYTLLFSGFAISYQR